MKRFAITTALAIGLMIAILALATGGMGWPDLEDPARQGEALDAAALRQGRIVHSQAAAARLIREPENTWSNLAFVIVGAVLFSLYPRRRARLVGVALIGVGLGSFAYHASASRTLRHLDVGAMYGLYVATTALAAAALSPALARGIEKHFWTIAAVAGVFAITAAGCRNYVILGGKPFALEPMTAVAAAILIAALVWVAIRERSAQRSARVIAALALFGAALICQIGDRPGRWLCAPDSIVQAHALWHILSALAVLVAVDTLEKRPPTQLSEATPGGGHLDRPITGSGARPRQSLGMP